MAVSGLWKCLMLYLTLTSIKTGAEHPDENFEAPPLETPEDNTRGYSTGWMELRVDHFNAVDNRTWRMRYFENDQFFQPGGPIFVYVGGFWPIRQAYLLSGQIYALAKKHSGYMFCPEHRFYGQSYPVDDLTTKSLQYLSTEQVLADLAYFTKHQKATVLGLEKSKVVLIGCVYAGTLATWARIKYPHVFNIAYASSAPLLAVDDFSGYFEAIGQNILRVSKPCYEVIEEAIKQTEKLLQTQAGPHIVSQRYNTCRPVENAGPGKAWFFKTIADIFAIANLKAGQIGQECDKLLRYKGSPFQKLSSLYKSKPTAKCFGGWTDFLTKYSNTKSTRSTYRQQYYQYCTEYGHFRTSASQKQPFRNTFPISLYHTICKELFGIKYNVDVLHAGVETTNLFYGGNTSVVNNLINAYGTADPWHKLGLSQMISEKAQTIAVDGAHMCEDLTTMKPNDPPEVTAAKLGAQELIVEWLK